jgi:signal transduction histidine kinase
MQLAVIVREAVDAIRPKLNEARLEYSLATLEEPIIVNADRTRLFQVILNLLNNAVKFTPAGGMIRIEVAVNRSMAEVSITDSGIGIAADALPRVFEMFTQIENSLSGENRGLGIGLNLSQQLAAMHGGNIEARSDGIGKGSQFVMRLPLAQSIEPGESR